MSYLCLKRDISDGHWQTFESFGTSAIVKRDGDKFIVAENRCAHRGFPIADGCGKGSLRCKYHGRRFDFDLRIKHYEFGEFIFLPSYLQASNTLADIGTKLGEQFGEHTQEVEAPFYLWIQNTADPNHLNFIHRDGFAKLFDGNKPEDVYVQEFESSYRMRIKDEVVARYAKHFDFDCDHFTHILAFPNLSVTSFLDVFFSIESAEPLGPNRSKITTRFFTRKDAKAHRLLISLALKANIKVLAEDKAIVEKWATTYRHDLDVPWMQGEERIKRYCEEIKTRGFV